MSEKSNNEATGKKNIDDIIAWHKEKLEKAEAKKIKDEESKKEKEAKKRTKKCILLGAYLLDKLPDDYERYIKSAGFDEYLTRNYDRRIFGLKEFPEFNGGKMFFKDGKYYFDMAHPKYKDVLNKLGAEYVYDEKQKSGKWHVTGTGTEKELRKRVRNILLAARNAYENDSEPEKEYPVFIADESFLTPYREKISPTKATNGGDGEKPEESS